jgi:hypothetical protein
MGLRAIKEDTPEVGGRFPRNVFIDTKDRRLPATQLVRPEFLLELQHHFAKDRQTLSNLGGLATLRRTRQCSMAHCISAVDLACRSLCSLRNVSNSASTSIADRCHARGPNTSARAIASGFGSPRSIARASASS